MNTSNIFELRVAVTTQDYERLVKFYCLGLGIEPAAAWNNDGGKALIIDESYNANPASMRATLAQLGATPARRRIAVLGAMKELGDFAPGLHAALAEPMTEAGVDHAVLVGDEMAALADELGKSASSALGKPLPFAHCRTPDEAHQALAQIGLQGGDAVLVKGSNSVGLGKLVSALAG